MSDVEILRDLARQYLELCHHPSQQAKRQHWRELNSGSGTGLANGKAQGKGSGKKVPPAIYIRAFAWDEMPESRLACQEPLLRRQESFFRQSLLRGGFGDDFLFEPWVKLDAVKTLPGKGLWGVETPWHYTEESAADGRGAGKSDPPLKEESDIDKLVTPRHRIDEPRTAADLAKLQEALDGVIPVCVDRAPAWSVWNADLCSALGELRGIETIMYDMMDRPAWLHRVLTFMRDGVLKAQQEAQAAGDWRLCSQYNQSMAYSLELPDPSDDPAPVARKDLWCFCASQELTLVGPEMWDEFMLQYQQPIMEQFGLAAYGCCEDLTRKIPRLRRVKNLRRIAVTPFADVARCAEQIGGDYVISYRPSPSDMVGYGFSPERIRTILRRDFEAMKANGCVFDITLKDVQTVQYDQTRIRNWVAIVREVIGEFWT